MNLILLHCFVFQVVFCLVVFIYMQTAGLYKRFQASHAWWDGHPSKDITQNPLMDFLAPQWFWGFSLVVCLRVLSLECEVTSNLHIIDQ